MTDDIPEWFSRVGMSQSRRGMRSRGRKTLPAAQRTISVVACILPAQREWALAFGGGNLSLGVRKAIAVAMQVEAKRTPVLPPNESPPTPDAFD